MIKPVMLELEGFRSFREKAVISFPDSGAVLVSGRYKDSSVSSGCGKSSILMGIALALGCCPIPATELKSWGTKSLRVALMLKDDEKRYLIVRDPKLTLEVSDRLGVADVLTGTAAEEQLAKLFKAPADLVKVLTYRVQREPGVFISATDSEKKEMLSALLGLSAIEAGYDKLKAEAAALDTKAGQLQVKIDTLKAQMQSVYVDQGKINQLHLAYTEAYNRLTSLQAVDVKTIENQIVLVKQEIDKGMRASRESAMARAEVSNIDRNVEQAATSIRALQEGLCPTCRQAWANSRSGIESLERQIDSWKSKKVELETIMKNAQLLEAAIPGWRAREQELSAQIYQQSAPLRDAQAALGSAKSAFDQASGQVSSYNSMLATAEQARLDLLALDTEKEIHKHGEVILGRNGFMSLIFDEVLEEIERLANDMMSEIPNVCEFSLKIDSVSTTKTGNTKKTISVVLYKDGKEISVRALSGGQACALDLVVDLAISDAIRRRSGTRLGWIALDEAMDGLDIETKRAALDVIKRKMSGLLIVVDHSTEIKESFEAVVEIEFDGRDSRVL